MLHSGTMAMIVPQDSHRIPGVISPGRMMKPTESSQDRASSARIVLRISLACQRTCSSS